jgi:uncharacterized protein YndB with AHSA1/START domain
MTTAQKLTITREFDAPLELVWQAITDPDHVAQWFGPEGFETPRESIEIDLRAGGRYELDMVMAGSHHPVRYAIAELDPPRLLVLTSPPMPEVGIHEETVTRIELEDLGGTTRMSLSDGPYEQPGHAEAGWNGALAKLDALLSRLRPRP